MTCKCSFGQGLQTCHCNSCHRTFTCSTAFARHQTIPREGNGWGLIVCIDPETMTRRNGDPVLAVLRETPDGSPIWGWYDKRSRKALFNVGAGI